MLIEFFRTDPELTVTAEPGVGKVSFMVTVDSDPCNRAATFEVTESGINDASPLTTTHNIGDFPVEFAVEGNKCTEATISVQAVDADGADAGSAATSSAKALPNGGELSKFCSYTVSL